MLFVDSIRSFMVLPFTFLPELSMFVLRVFISFLSASISDWVIPASLRDALYKVATAAFSAA